MTPEEINIKEAVVRYKKSRPESEAVSFLDGALSNEAKEYHNKGMYSEVEVKALLLRICHDTADYIENNANGIESSAFDVNEWFNNNKK